MDLEKLTTGVCAAAERAAAFVRTEAEKFSATDVREKSAHNLVTYIDEQSEKMLIADLSALLPGSGFIAEESPQLQRKALNWVVDPLDGTTNFIHGLPIYCISIALMEGDEVVLGVIYEASQKEFFYTWKGAPAFLNGKPIHVSRTATLNDSLFATGFPYYDYSRLDRYMEFFRFMMQNSRGVRRLGSAAADLAWVACGRFDGFYEYGLSPWDVAAGTILVANAGGKVCDFRSGSDFIFGKEIVATNGTLHKEFMTHFDRHFNGTAPGTVSSSLFEEG
jgi:myo-inositol-1(or 4)-monophosphatase